MSDETESSTAAETRQLIASRCENGNDWREQLYARIQILKESYFDELRETHKKFVKQPQPQSNRVGGRGQLFKAGLEGAIEFLKVSKSQITPDHMRSLSLYENYITHFLHLNRNILPSQDFRELPPPRIDWQEEPYQTLKLMKESYMPELNQIYKRATTELEKQYSLRQQQPRPCLVENLKVFKFMLERIMTLLHVYKGNITPYIKNNLTDYQKEITYFLDGHQIYFELQSTNIAAYVTEMLHYMKDLITLFDASKCDEVNATKH